MEGWVKIFRKMRDWEWYKNSNTKDLFIHLLLSANNEDKMWHGILVKRGQLATSLSSLASDLGMSIQNVRTSIANLKSTHEITSESTNKLTIITVCRFEDYQESQQTDQHADQHATQQQTNNKQEEKNIYPPYISKDILSPLKDRQDRFYNDLVPFIGQYGKEMLREFYDYWSETDRSSKPRMRFEKEKTWCLDRRLERWRRNNEEFKRPRATQQQKPSKLDQYKAQAQRLGLLDYDTDQSNSIDEQ